MFFPLWPSVVPPAIKIPNVLGIFPGYFEPLILSEDSLQISFLQRDQATISMSRADFRAALDGKKSEERKNGD